MIGVLADHPDDGSTVEREAWSRRLETSLASEPGWWVHRVGSTGSQDLSTSEAWVLLGWVETAASRIGTEGRADLVERVAFALALREAGPLDRRDRSVVASLVRSLEDGSGRCTRSADGVDRASSRLLHALRRRDRAHRRGPRDEQQNKQG